MPTRDLDIVSSALNFTTPDLHVLGGCDLYTTKAAGGDKKLTKKIENGLEAQYRSNLQFSQSLSPPQVTQMASTLNLSRSSPFGNLGMVSSRRTYAYLIATLNASHPDYDFSHLLRPSDFKRVKHLRTVMNELDTMLYNLRPRATGSFINISGLQPGSACPPPSQTYWGPGTWRLIDHQMSLKECEIYCYKPDNYDLFEDDEEGSIWSMHYFFFNKARKRVCYLYLRGVSILSHSPSEPPRTPITPRPKRYADESESDGWLTPDLGARKRAKYWLGDRNEEDVHVAEHDDVEVISPSSSDMPAINVEKSPSEEEPYLPPKRPLVDEHDNYILSDEEVRSQRSDSKSTVRALSEEIAASMDV
jgi:Maf1 regulator